jgi:protein ImuA
MQNPVTSSAITELRHKLERLSSSASERKVLGFGINAIDQWLPSGGLALGAVHEICEQGTDSARASLAALFAAGALARCRGQCFGVCTAAICLRPLWRASACIRIA